MSRTDPAQLLTDLIHHAEQIMSEIDASDNADESFKPTIRSAILWHFVVLGEIATRLGESFHEEHSEIPWRLIIDQRNVIAHGYDIINWERLYALRARELPTLIENAKNILKSYPPPPSEHSS